MKTEIINGQKVSVRKAANSADYFPCINGKRIEQNSFRLDLAWEKARTYARGFDGNVRWGNCGIPGAGVNSPAMMEARAKFAEPTTASHTPGPWVAEHNNNEVQTRFVRHEEKSYATIAKVESIEVYTTPDSVRTHSEVAANLNLIAAAPELLAALETALRHMEIEHGDRSGDFEAITGARAAIAKSRGGNIG